MSNTPSLTLAARIARYEVVEERLVLSAQPIPSLVQHVELVAPVETPVAVSGELANHLETGLAGSGAPGVVQHLNNAHAATGVADARADYGFTGAGQTVVVIDSGIAYDHVALGGGFGPGHRVVGGWDFAENDANPFDDAPAGFHGTHVAGIIGSDNATYSGVAPEVDLVALRVFDDVGNGDFAWVEDALEWVLANKDSFANPITTVNMSIGAPEQNYGGVPWWAMLEDELQDLYAAGIFVSVSAGNDFQDFNAQGLSYPAVSPWVVPVASANDAGTTLSGFSQRDDHVLVAPGESIASSVPDELFSFDGVANDWASASGTSMASPYVAGASVLVRQAYDFMGVANVDQAMIYDALFDTARLIYDPITAASYHFIDVEAALSSIITDAYGDTEATAASVGALANGDSFAEQIGKLSDRDYFTFTAAQSGAMTLSADADGQMVAQWDLIGGGGSVDGNSLSFDVVAGQSYTVGLMSSGGMGHYTVNSALIPDAIDWGVVERTHVDDVAVAGEAWYSITATRAGLVTVEASYAGGENVNVEIYNGSGQLLWGGTNTSGHTRCDAEAVVGAALYVRVTGTAAAADFSLWNVVGIDGSTATVLGTAGDDAFTFAAGADHAVSVNGLSYLLDGASITNIEFQGGDGNDQFDATGGAGDDTAELRPDSLQLSGDGYVLSCSALEEVTLHGGGGASDRADFMGSAGDDLFVGRPTFAFMQGGGYLNFAFDFDQVTASAGAGNDLARFFDSAGDEVLTASPTQARMQGVGFDHTAIGFDRVDAHASAGGHDTAHLTGSAGNDEYIGRSTLGYLRGTGYFNVAYGFDQVTATAGAGNDTALLYDTSGDEVFTASSTEARLQGVGFDHTAAGFDRVNAYATAGGNDTANLAGSAGDDRFVGQPTLGFMAGAGYYNVLYGFDQIFATAAGGNDLARFFDSTGDDVLTAGSSEARFQGVGFDHTATGFDTVDVRATAGGSDTADFFGSAGNDLFVGRRPFAYMSGAGYFNVAYGFDQTTATAGGGNDLTRFFDSNGNDVLTAGSTEARFQGVGFDHTATGFDRVDVRATAGGNDTAYLTGDAGNDLFMRQSTFGYLRGSNYFNVAYYFEQVFATAGAGGDDVAQLYGSDGDDEFDVDSSWTSLQGDGTDAHVGGFARVEVDLSQGGFDSATLLGVLGDEQLWGSGSMATLSGGGRDVEIEGLEVLTADSALGHTPVAEFEAVDYLFFLLGDWDEA